MGDPTPVVERTGRRLVLLRHGQTWWNATGRAQGHADVSIDDVGHAQAEAAAPYLASLRPAAMWSSDLARARETCAYLEKATGLTTTFDERLREFGVGQRQGLTMAEFAERFPDAYDARLEGDYSIDVPGAEDAGAVENRIVPVLRQCLSSLGPGETGLVVTHGAALKVAVCGLLRWAPEVASDLRGVDNCAWVTIEELEADGRPRLVGYNESVRPGRSSPETL